MIPEVTRRHDEAPMPNRMPVITEPGKWPGRLGEAEAGVTVMLGSTALSEDAVMVMVMVIYLPDVAASRIC